MSIQSQIARIKQAKNNIIVAIEEKGVNVPTTVKIDNLDEYVLLITNYNLTQELDNESVGVYLTQELNGDNQEIFLTQKFN